MRLIDTYTLQHAAGAIAVLAAIGLFSSCKGRTLKDVEPNGETIEVAVPTQEEASTDSLESTPLQFQNY